MIHRLLLFGLFEIVAGLLLGGGGVKLLIRGFDNGDLNQSIMRGAICFLSFSFVGISGIGFLHHKFSTKTNFVNGVLGGIFGLTLGMMFSAPFYSPLAIAICTVFLGTLGFNIGLLRNPK